MQVNLSSTSPSSSPSALVGTIYRYFPIGKRPTMSKADAAYDILRGQILLQQCAIDALLTFHPRRDELADAFTVSSAEFIKMISAQKDFEAEAIQVVKMMRASMLRRLGRADS